MLASRRPRGGKAAFKGGRKRIGGGNGASAEQERLLRTPFKYVEEKVPRSWLYVLIGVLLLLAAVSGGTLAIVYQLRSSAQDTAAAEAALCVPNVVPQLASDID